MKVTAFFFDNYSKESIWIAAFLWPIYFITLFSFYNMYWLYAFVASLIIASFSALFFADSCIQYVCFLLGFCLLLFGTLTMLKPTKKNIISWMLSSVITALCGFLVYLGRTKIYNIHKIPTTVGYVNFLDPGYWIWISIQIILYLVVVVSIAKTNKA